jgi:hypothetical protein
MLSLFSNSNASSSITSLDGSDTIPRLKFISRLKKGDKINVKNLYVQPNNFYNRIDRSFFNVDDRTNTLTFVQNTIKNGFELFYTHSQNSPQNQYDKILCENIITDIKNTKIGLLNLKETYIDDVMFVCKIDTLIEETEAKIVDILSVEKGGDIRIDRSDKGDRSERSEKNKKSSTSLST